MRKLFLCACFLLVARQCHPCCVLPCQVCCTRPESSLAKTRPAPTWPFQFSNGFAHDLIEKGIRLDCPEMENLKDPKQRPGHMQKLDWVPCACEQCFFCEHGFAHGLSHKQKYSRAVHSATLSSVGHTDVSIRMNNNGQVSIAVGVTKK